MDVDTICDAADSAIWDSADGGETMGTLMIVRERLLAEKCLLCNTGQEAMEQLGVMVFNAKGDMRANIDIVSDLEGALMKQRAWEGYGG